MAKGTLAKAAVAATGPEGEAAAAAASAVKPKPKPGHGAAPGKSPSRLTPARRKKIIKLAVGRKWVLAEFVLCLLLLGLSGITGSITGSDGIEQTGSRLAIKGSALGGVFIVLGLVSAGGKGATKAAGALGAVITLAYVFNERATFAALAKWAGTQAKG